MTTRRNIKIAAAILLIIGIIIIGIGIKRASALGAVRVGFKTAHENSVFQRGSSRASSKAAAELKKDDAATLHDRAQDVKEA